MREVRKYSRDRPFVSQRSHFNLKCCDRDLQTGDVTPVNLHCGFKSLAEMAKVLDRDKLSHDTTWHLWAYESEGHWLESRQI
jgi:hypothetical protein